MIFRLFFSWIFDRGQCSKSIYEILRFPDRKASILLRFVCHLTPFLLQVYHSLTRELEGQSLLDPHETKISNSQDCIANTCSPSVSLVLSFKFFFSILWIFNLLFLFFLLSLSFFLQQITTLILRLDRSATDL